MNKLVSIIIPSFNSAEYISKTIQSVLLQTYDDWEMIIVDDCSTDNSVNIINDFVSIDSRIKLIQLQKNSGAAVARNTGIQYAQGRFIAFLDSDDSWNDRKLEKQVHFMLANDYAFTYTAYHKVNELDENIGNMYIPNKVNYHQLLKTCIIGCLTAMYDVHKLGKVEFPLIRKRQDFALWLKILKQESFAYGLQEDLASYTVRSDSISANKFKAAQYNWQLYRHIEKLPLLKSCYYFFHYAVKGIIRSKFPKVADLLKI
ncbi:glycosyltransferase family 2 protein [Acinetobacter baumannii]|nr:glycosyltransferase family 2 protein [Acinetobacter baumannii]EHZ6828062.1 glycosyltransferase family 2 protein [Acinetobacter baumannii]EHZ7527104.1 glycosyltransferase family 2 protein [Acinetobacter baumannii]EHZ7599040.1 glycosyltransferase family 2 protein [Acinetobacter baumannii]EIJ5800098.1 glycosyltransferase family 2 protein [Acinetobacter baumannii]